MTLQTRIHFLNFVRKLSVTSVLFLLPLHFLKPRLRRLADRGHRLPVRRGSAPRVLPHGLDQRPRLHGRRRPGRPSVQGPALRPPGLDHGVSRSWPPPSSSSGLANNALDVSFKSLYYKDETDMDQNRKYGIYVFWMGLGPAVGILAAAFLIQVADFRPCFLAFAAIMLAILAAGPRRLTATRFHLVAFRDYGRDFLRPKTLLFVLFVFFLGPALGRRGDGLQPLPPDRSRPERSRAALFIAAELFFLPFSAAARRRRKFDPRANKRLVLAAMAALRRGLHPDAVTGDVVLSLRLPTSPPDRGRGPGRLARRCSSPGFSKSGASAAAPGLSSPCRSWARWPGP